MLRLDLTAALKTWRKFRIDNLPKVEHAEAWASPRRDDDGMILVADAFEVFANLNPLYARFREELLADYPGGSFCISKNRWQVTKARAAASSR
jgi:hypothetical protein